MVILTALGFVAPVFGASVVGDGANTNNPDLLRGSYGDSCADVSICGGVQADHETSKQTVTYPPPAQEKVIRKVDCALLEPSEYDYGNCPKREYSVVPQPQRVARPYKPHLPVLSLPDVDADWSVTLRGTYQQGSGGDRLVGSVLPEGSVTRRTSRGEVVFGANAELTKEGEDDFRLSGGALEFDASYAVNNVTSVSSSANLSVTQASPYAFGTGTSIATAPIIISGSADAGIRRQAGVFDLELRGNIAREIYGTTQLATGVWSDNKDRNRLGLGFGGRLIQELSARISGFIDGSVERSIYDAPSSTLGAKRDGWTYAISGGFTGNWGDVVEAEISAGYGLRRFDSALLSSAPTALLDAELIYRPDDSVELSALFETSILTPEASSDAAVQIEYSASSSASYRINDQFGVRASLGASWTRVSGSSQIDRTYSAGVGADLNINAHTQLSADYNYNLSETDTSGTEESHQVALGVTFSR